MPLIEKAILTSDLGLNPTTAGQVIRIPLPPLTEERRKDLGRVVHQEGENAKIAIRNIRRDAIHDVKDLMKEKLIGEDDEHRAEDEIQTITDKHIAEIDQILADKDWNSEFVTAYNITGIPRFILIDPEGNIFDANAPRPSDPRLRELLSSLKL